MSNCDDLLRQIAELKQQQARQQADLDYTERVSRLLANDQSGSPVTQMLRRFLGAMDSESTQQLVRRAMGLRETPMGGDGRFIDNQAIGKGCNIVGRQHHVVGNRITKH